MNSLLNLFNALVTWNSNFEDNPEGGDSPSYGDDEIRLLKSAIRERFEKEHTMDLTTGTSGSDGWHKNGVAKVYYQATAPTTRPDGTTALTSADNGRLWIRSTDYRVNFYVHGEGTDGWVAASTINGADNELTGANTFTGNLRIPTSEPASLENGDIWLA